MIKRDGSTNELLLDFDDLEPLPRLLPRLSFLSRALDFHVKSLTYCYSSGGRGIHVVILLRESLPASLVVSLQLLCGSDWRRETFNLVRVKNLRHATVFWRQRWNTLYSQKWRTGK